MKRPDFIKNYKDHLDEKSFSYPGSEELLVQGASVGRLTGLKKIGIHIEVMAPGRRTSWPHAESTEEEFAYVIEGTPQVWIDGHVHDLSPGDFIGFPSGTGIAHTFINNTKDTCLLLVGGQTNQDDNKCVYPLHPKRNEEIKKNNFLWEDSPKRELGPHDGMSDELRKRNLNEQ